MAFASVLVLTIAVLIPIGVLAIAAARRDPSGRARRWSGSAGLCLGFGLILILAAPADIHAPVRVFGTALWILSCGLSWGAARLFDRRAAPFEAVVGGALAWLVLAALLDPPQVWRAAATSLLVAAYSFATAREYWTGGGLVPARLWAARIFAAHGSLFLLRAILGPAFGFASQGAEAASGLLLVAEMVAVGVLATGLSLVLRSGEAVDAPRPVRRPGWNPRLPSGWIRRRLPPAHPAAEAEAPFDSMDLLEDGLTGVGNRRALSASGEPLLAAARAAGRPAALLAMGVEGGGTGLHGGSAVDQLLIAFARFAHDYLPPTSLVCRIDGDTFAAVLPGAAPPRARAIAEEIRALFAHLPIPGPHGPMRATVSIGVCVAAAADRVALDALLARAEARLAAARASGGDRVAAEGDPVPSSTARHRGAA